jgi:Cellulose binding domain
LFSSSFAWRRIARRAGLHALLILTVSAGGSLVATGAVGTLATPASAAPVNCDGDGQSGKRVQLLYMRGDAQPNNLANWQARMLDIPARIDLQFLEAARRTGGPSAYRAVRWVTDANCVPTITPVVIPQAIIDSNLPFPDYENQLHDQLRTNGPHSDDRKYVVWYERDKCGVGYGYGDDSPGASNAYNDSGYAMIGLAGCFEWGATAHELLHTMGAVQPSAPHGTAGGHCWDDRDIMCYDEGQMPHPLTVVCGTSDTVIDCNGDDYFNVSPPAGSYLDTNWNVANSAYLIKTAPAGGARLCTVAYTKSEWGGNNFTADLTVTNTTGPALSTWQLTFPFAGDQHINSSWPGPFTQAGQNVTLNPDPGTPSSLGVGASVHAFFNANYSGTNPDPTLFRLNGQMCASA